MGFAIAVLLVAATVLILLGGYMAYRAAEFDYSFLLMWLVAAILIIMAALFWIIS